MIETLHPWIGLAFGIALSISSLKMIIRPDAYVCVGIIPASDPRTVKYFGDMNMIFATLILGANLHYFFTE